MYPLLKISVAPSWVIKTVQITNITLKRILNSKRESTIQATVKTKKGKGVASAPQGTSEGRHEAVFMPKKVDSLIKYSSNLVKELIGLNIFDQKGIDKMLQKIDGTDDFSNIGGCTSIAVSSACLKCAADSKKMPLYKYLKPKESIMPMLAGKCIGGGVHSKRKSADFQEFLSIPITKSIAEAVSVNKKMHLKVKKLLNATKKDYEGGWVKNISNEKALDIMSIAVDEIYKKTKVNVALGIDVAATNLWGNKRYIYKDSKKDSREQLSYIARLIEEYGLYYVEDPFHEDDFKSHAKITKIAPDSLICGDDLFTTNKERLGKGIKIKSCNSIIIKPNQIGTITQTKETLELAKRHGYATIISHRSGETKDPLIADLAVGWTIPFIKIGIVGPERTAKTNKLVKIWKQEKKKK